jgi:thiosulfate/3-mercaptopyruvate sulfurtransferase
MDMSTLISARELAHRLGEPGVVIADCRFDLADPAAGQAQYLERHVPGAVYAHLDWHLAGPIVPGVSGRHPLPDWSRLAHTLGLWGVGPSTFVVAYDAAGGSMAGARLWWLLQWLGHPLAAVLDGGWQAWSDGPWPVEGGPRVGQSTEFVADLQPQLVVDADQVDEVRCRKEYRLLDARSADRYRGQNETIDPVSGHIPCALSAPYLDNLGPDGRFLTPQELRQHYSVLLGDVPAVRTIAYCGSGVTAAHDVLAIAHAGLGMARLYAGSWSEWITRPYRPVALGAEP